MSGENAGNLLGIRVVWRRRGGDCRKATQRCPCGWFGHAKRGCICTPAQLAHYAARVSDPLRDRIDLQVSVSSLTPRELAREEPGEPSAAVAARVAVARARQVERGMGWNAQLSPRDLRRAVVLKPPARSLLEDAAERLGLSARGAARAQRVARTIADLEGASEVGAEHLAEALQYRGYEAGRLAER